MRQIRSTLNGVSPVNGWRQDAAIGDVVQLSLVSPDAPTTIRWLLIGRPEGSVAGGAGPEPVLLGTGLTASFTVDDDSGYAKDGTYTVECVINEGSVGEAHVTTGIARLSGLTLPDGRPLRKLGGFENAAEDTSVPTILQGWATQMNRWLERVRTSGGGGGGGSPGGPNNAVQFNAGGTFGGSANFTWTGAQLDVVGSFDVGSNKLHVDSVGNLTRIHSVTYSWPGSQGGAATFLRNDGSGNLTWVPGTGTPPGGPSASVQFNSAGVFAGSANLTWNGTSLAVVGVLDVASGNFHVDATGNPTKVNNVTTSFPSIQGGAGTFLQNDGAGTLTWASVVTTPAGSNTQVQFNNAGAFGASANFTWSGTQLAVVGAVDVASGKFHVDNTGNITKINNVTTSWPSVQGGASTFLQNNGSGTLTWAAASFSPAGSNTQIQFNNSGSFGASASLTWDGTTLSATALAIGSAKFAVDSTGNITKINNVTTSWPASQGGASTFLRNDGSGNLTWVTGSGVTSPGGSNTQVQYNSSGAFAGASGLTYSANNNTLVGGATDVASTVLRLDASKTVASATSAVWDGVDHIAATLTLSGATHVTTATGVNAFVFRAPTISAASALTVDNSATVMISGAPTGGGAGPATLTNKYALWVQAGATRLDGSSLSINTVAYSWPGSQGGANTFLKNDGSGNLTWAAGGATSPAGSDTQVQFNNAGSFGASSGLTWTTSSQQLKVTSSTNTNTPLVLQKGLGTTLVTDTNAIMQATSDTGTTNIWLGVSGSGTNCTVGFAQAGTIKHGIVWNRANNYLVLTRDGSNATPTDGLFISSNTSGRIGINKNNPSVALDVSGQATVTSTTFPVLLVTGALSANEVMQVSNTDATGLSTISFANNSGTAKGSFGWGNGSFSPSAYQNRMFASKAAGIDFIVIEGSTIQFKVDGTTGNVHVGAGTFNAGSSDQFSIDTSGKITKLNNLSAQTSGANLTNNVTSGGTNDQIDNFTDLTTYSVDAATIRNDIFQLSRKLKQVNDGLRAFGLFT